MSFCFRPNAGTRLITDWWKKLLFSAVLLLVSCHEERAVQLGGQSGLFYTTAWVVDVELRNRGSESACVPAYQFSPAYGTFEVRTADDKRVSPLSSGTRMFQMFQGLDVVDGIYVIPPGKTKRLLTRLDNFDVHAGEKPKVVFDLVYASCADLFKKRGQTAILHLKLATSQSQLST